MHFIAKALFVSTLIITVKAQIGESGLEVLMNHTIAECQVIEKATDGDIETLFYDNDDWPETRAGECFVECFLEGIGIFKNHKFHKRGLLEFWLMFVGEFGDSNEVSEEFKDVVRRVDEECGRSTSEDRCENALDFAKCCKNILEPLDEFSNDISKVDANDVAEY